MESSSHICPIKAFLKYWRYSFSYFNALISMEIHSVYVKNQIKQKLQVKVMHQQTNHCSLCFMYYEYWDLLKVSTKQGGWITSVDFSLFLFFPVQLHCLFCVFSCGRPLTSVHCDISHFKRGNNVLSSSWTYCLTVFAAWTTGSLSACLNMCGQWTPVPSLAINNAADGSDT